MNTQSNFITGKVGAILQGMDSAIQDERSTWAAASAARKGVTGAALEAALRIHRECDLSPLEAIKLVRNHMKAANVGAVGQKIATVKARFAHAHGTNAEERRAYYRAHLAEREEGAGAKKAAPTASPTAEQVAKEAAAPVVVACADAVGAILSTYGEGDVIAALRAMGYKVTAPKVAKAAK